jgi:hypothetical protein
MSRPMRGILKVLAVLAIIVIVLTVLGAVVMWLWNALVPQLFHGPVLQYWQAVGLLVLCRLLFGGMRARGWHGHRRRRLWRERWEQMTPEERSQLRERMAGRCGRARGSAADATP